MDATYNVNNYDFHLITLLVLDDYQEGIPAAYAISNREDKVVIKYILESIKLNLNPVFGLCQTWLYNISMHGKKYLIQLLPNIYGVDGISIVHGERR